MFQQALWTGDGDQEDKGQEVDLIKSMTGAGLERGSAPEHSHKVSFKFEYRHSDPPGFEEPAVSSTFA
jgi:hypothetical protein